ncbi:MAG: PilZ domain-containing protein, partial [Ectothiorhodospira sp.]
MNHDKGVRMSMGMDEKRDFQRLQVDHPVRVTETDSGQTHEALGRDLSATGAAFVMQAPLPVGTTVSLAIEPGSTMLSPFRA